MSPSASRRLSQVLFGLIVLTAVATQPGKAQLLLVGGHLPVCTSLSRHCSQALMWGEDALESHAYRPTAARVERWLESVGEPADSAAAREWRAVLSTLAAHQSATDRRWLSEQLSVAAPELFQTLDERARWQLFDHLQDPLGRRREAVNLSQTTSQAVIAIFERFVAMARETSGRERPRIGISTASSRDPYDALAFYLQVFEQAGAEVHWLALDRAVNAARAAGRCEDLAEFQAEKLGSWDRARVFPSAFAQQQALCADPEATLQLAANLDGLFLNGGDQWLTLHAFIDEQGRPGAEWQRILARLQAGEMVLGGTSAGAAVQSGPVMISNGSSRRALLEGAHESPPPPAGCDAAGSCPPGLSADSLSFHRGGLGSFALGIVDTHFSERWRQFRLLQLMVDSGVALGLGVDETSAIEVSGLFDDQPVILQAHGASGGWLILTDTAVVASQRPLQLRGVGLHYLRAGARLALETMDRPDAIPESAADALHESQARACHAYERYSSFADLPLFQSRAAQSGSHCLLYPLDDTTVLRSDFHPSSPPATATGIMTSWQWSLEPME
ncbi:MAG: cyanophycinase [Wenzhouxiangella sp.]